MNKRFYFTKLSDKELDFLQRRNSMIGEMDKGQVTDNPYLLVKRQLLSGSPGSLDILNSILSQTVSTQLTEDQYNALLAIASVPVQFPIVPGDPDTIKKIGRDLNKSHSESAKNRIVGVYVFTNTNSGKQYVGSSINMGARVRTYMSSAKLEQNRSITKDMRTLGHNLFTLQVFTIDMTLPVFSNMKGSVLCLALEQYMMLLLNPGYNHVLVAGMAPEPTGVLAGNNVKKPFFVYNADKTELLYKTESQKDFVADMGVSSQSVLDSLNKGKLLYGTFFLSRLRLDGAVDGILSDELFKSLVKEAFKDRYNKRALSSSIINSMQPVTLTNLLDGSPSVSFKSKNEAYRYTGKFPGRVVSVQKMKRTDSFEYKGWLIEFD